MKPFPGSFWRTYSVDTLLGYWLPNPVAKVVDKKLAGDVKPYLGAIKRQTAARHIDAIAMKLEAGVKKYRRKRWIKEQPSVVEAWRDRVVQFRKGSSGIRVGTFPERRLSISFEDRTFSTL